jgi:hypothetical protein
MNIEPSSAGTPFPEVIMLRCPSLESARRKKGETRDRYKEQRRAELQRCCDYASIKRRKKSSVPMSDHQTYMRGLKMSQVCAAAARYAREVYYNALETLVVTWETKYIVVAREMSTTRADVGAEKT